MFLAILYLAVRHHAVTGMWSFALEDLATLDFASGVQTVLFLAFALAFAIKVPVFPLHTWLPDAHTEAPTAGSIILAGVLLKLGVYGYLRFGLTALPRGGAAVRAVGRPPRRHRRRLRRPRRVPAEGHEAARRVLLGLAPRARRRRRRRLHDRLALRLDPPDDQPRPLDRRALPPRRRALRAPPHARDRGLRRPRRASCPVTTALFLVATLSSIGLPGLNGFVGEFLILLGTWTSPHRWWAVARRDRSHPLRGLHADARAAGLLESRRARGEPQPARDPPERAPGGGRARRLHDLDRRAARTTCCRAFRRPSRRSGAAFSRRPPPRTGAGRRPRRDHLRPGRARRDRARDHARGGGRPDRASRGVCAADAPRCSRRSRSPPSPCRCTSSPARRSGRPSADGWRPPRSPTWRASSSPRRPRSPSSSPSGTCERAGEERGEFYALLLWGHLGVSLMVRGIDLLVIFIGLETLSLAFYVLAAIFRAVHASSEAGLKYFLTGAFGSAFTLYGIALLFGRSGEPADLVPLAGRPRERSGRRLRAAASPRRASASRCRSRRSTPGRPTSTRECRPRPWPTSRSLRRAPALIVLYRVLTAVYQGALPSRLQTGIAALAILSMTLGNVVALAQRDIKRLLAYSGIAHMGYITITLAIFGRGAFAAAIVYLFAYLVSNAGAFACVSVLYRDETRPHPVGSPRRRRTARAVRGRRAHALLLLARRHSGDRRASSASSSSSAPRSTAGSTASRSSASSTASSPSATICGSSTSSTCANRSRPRVRRRSGHPTAWRSPSARPGFLLFGVFPSGLWRLARSAAESLPFFGP